MPKSWFEDSHTDIGRAVQGSGGLSFATNNALLLNMIVSAHETGNLNAKYVGVDASYGSDAAFLMHCQRI
jgi:hypothetical protein